MNTTVTFPVPAGRRLRHYGLYFGVSPADIIKTAVAYARQDQYPLAIPKLFSDPLFQNVPIRIPIFFEPSPPDSPRFGDTCLVPRRVLEAECKKLATINPKRLQTWLLAGVGMLVFHQHDSLSYTGAGISQWARVIHALLHPPAEGVSEPATLSEFSPTSLAEPSGIDPSLPYGWIPVTPEGPFEEPVCESVDILEDTAKTIASRYVSVDEWVIDQTLHSLETRQNPIFPGECIAIQANIYAMKIPRAVMQWIGHVADHRELYRAQVLREFLYAGAGLWLAMQNIATQFAAEVKNASQ